MMKRKQFSTWQPCVINGRRRWKWIFISSHFCCELLLLILHGFVCSTEKKVKKIKFINLKESFFVVAANDTSYLLLYGHRVEKRVDNGKIIGSIFKCPEKVWKKKFPHITQPLRLIYLLFSVFWYFMVELA